MNIMNTFLTTGLFFIVLIVFGCRSQAMAASEISKEEAESLAGYFLKSIGKKPSQKLVAEKHLNTCHLQIKSKNNTWTTSETAGCYFVHYLKNAPRRFLLTGEPMVVVSLDGKKIGEAPLE